jgi:ADP-heptose:LPS heptosyltransferase
MVEWVRLGDLMVTNDTGPMHVAAALDKPMVGIFGPTDPHRTGPYRRLASVIRVELPCAPCLKSRCAFAKPMECLRAISPGMVLERVHQQLPASA